jgi:diacylglycerol kinase (ATP)
MFADDTQMKNRPFHHRIRYAIKGIHTGFKSEASFRTQCVFASGAVVLLVATKPKPVWWALVALVVAAVLAAELFNTALEFIIDRLHPEQHSMIARAKDCAAGAVLLLSLASVGVAVALILDVVNSR